MNKTRNPIQFAGAKQILGRFRKKHPGQITALDLDGQSLTVVEAKRSGSGVVVTKIASTALDVAGQSTEPDAAQLGAAIQQALKELRLKPGEVVMGIPRNVVALRTLSVPAADSIAELASIVHYQVSKDLPFRPEEAVIDFRIRKAGATIPTAQAITQSGGPSSETVEVLAAAVRRETVQHSIACAHAAGFRLASLGLRSYAHVRCVRACGVAASPDEALALVSLRPGEAIIDVLADENLVFSRVATVKPSSGDAAPPSESGGPNAEASDSSTYGKLVAIEIVRSLHNYEGMEAHKPIASILISGQPEAVKEALEALATRVSIPAHELDPSMLIPAGSNLPGSSPSVIAALGLAFGALDSNGLPFDFVNPKRPPVHRDTGRIKALAAAALVAIALFSVGALRISMVKKRNVVLDEARQQLRSAEQQRPLFRRLRLQMNTTDEWLQTKRPWLDSIAHLSALLPSAEDAYLSSISTSGRGAVILSVHTRSGGILNQIDRTLRTAGYDVKPFAVTPASDRHGYGFKANIEVQLPTEPLDVDLPNLRAPARPADDVLNQSAGPNAGSPNEEAS